MEYLDTFNLEKIPFKNMKDKDSLLFFDGTRSSVREELSDPHSLLARVVKKWEESIQSLCHDYKTDKVSWTDLIAKYSEKSLLCFLRDSGWDEELIEGFAKYGIGLGAYRSILGLSFIEILRLFIDSYESCNYQLKGGMENLVHAFLFDKKCPLHKRIHYACRVTNVKQASDGRYHVSYFSASEGSTMSVGAE